MSTKVSGVSWNGTSWNGTGWNGNRLEWNRLEWNRLEWNRLEWNRLEYKGAREYNKSGRGACPRCYLDSTSGGKPLFLTCSILNFTLTPARCCMKMPVNMKTSRFLLRGFRRPREIACFALGKLERQVMEETWRLGEVSVRDIHRTFDQQIAYTTLMTTLDRLFKKKLLERRKDGRAFVYAPVVSREDLDRGIKEDVVDGLLGHGADGVEPVLACIVDTISERDRELLDELDRLVQEKKRELRRKA